MPNKDVSERADIEDIVSRFYEKVLADPIIGFIFSDIAKIDLESHLPVIVDFWQDALLDSNLYQNNTLQKHLDIHQRVPLKPGHFTRWLFLFEQAVRESHQGRNCDKMIERANSVAKSISAAVSKRKRQGLRLTLEEYSGKN